MEPFRAGLGNGEERKEGREEKEGKGVRDRKEGMRKKGERKGIRAEKGAVYSDILPMLWS